MGRTLAAAFEQQKRWGWDKGTWGSVKGPCMLGACGVAWHNNHMHYGTTTRLLMEGSPQITLLAKVIREQFPERICATNDGQMVIGFNDHPDTTRDDVWAVWEKAVIAEQELV